MIELTRTAIDSSAVNAAVRDERFGGVVLFEGVVREDAGRRPASTRAQL